MKLTDRQQQFPIPWANAPESGTISPIPKNDPGDGSASLSKGFPKATMTPIAAGGKPPRGDQFNGIFNQLSLSAQNNDMGVIPLWRADFAQAIGGYPLTSQVTVIRNSVPDILVSICDNNLDDPNDPHQKNWVSIKSGLQTTGNFVTQNDPTKPPDSNKNIGVQWFGYNVADGTVHMTVIDPDSGKPSYPNIGVPIGTIVMISSYNIPDGWLQLAGQRFDKSVYPALFNFMGTNYLPDYRGRFPRGAKGSWINVPEVGTYQGDTIRNITGGTSWMIANDRSSSAWGAMSQQYINSGNPENDGGNGFSYTLNFDASQSVPTDFENRPLSVISNFIIKAK